MLVAIAHFGAKNRLHVERLIAEYRAMSFTVDIVVLSESPKNLGPGVTEVIGLPTSDPWSLPFSHRRLFQQAASKYDLFIYTEDDTLILEHNIRAFLLASERLPGNLLPGFIRYELYADGSKNYPEIHGPFHWIPGSVARWNEYIYAELSNDHSACYMVTQQQLLSAIDSGGYALTPHSGRYDLLCAAATDPYTQCGFSRVICLSHRADFELHHLPNSYLNRTGLSEKHYRLQIGALFDILTKKCSSRELFMTEKPADAQGWNKDYYEPCRDRLISFIPADAKRVLSVGCGSGDLEASLIESGREVTAIPLDSVIGRLAESRGVRLLPPDFADAFEAIGDVRFDAIVMAHVLQHLRSPVDVLSRLGTCLTSQGILVASVPNLLVVRRLLGRLTASKSKWSTLRGTFDDTALNFTTVGMLRGWLKASGLRLLDAQFDTAVSRSNSLVNLLPEAVTASDLSFAAEVASQPIRATAQP